MTNDYNEGALGAMCVAKHKAPNMTLETYNTHKMYKHNDTQSFMDAILNAPEDWTFLRQIAHIMGAEG
jgi:hypothetical protein